MSRWAVVRVVADDGGVAQRLLVEAYAPVTMTVDMAPAASGPEWEIRVQDRVERDVRRVLAAGGVSVLASKTVLVPALLGELDFVEGSRGPAPG